jgi:hypothetical protein
MRMDGHDEANSRVLQFCELAKKTSEMHLKCCNS